METGREVLLSTQHILKSLVKNRLKDSDCFLWLIKRTPPPVSVPVSSHSSSRASKYRKDKKEKKEYLKQMSEMAKIVQQQRMEKKKLDNFFSDCKRQALLLIPHVRPAHKYPISPWEMIHLPGGDNAAGR
jgi:hypothetical protein